MTYIYQITLSWCILVRFGELEASVQNSESWEPQSKIRRVRSLPFGKITNPPKNCRRDWSLKIVGKMGALDSERWEYRTPTASVSLSVCLREFSDILCREKACK